jgi:hypothetical protein
MLILCKLGWRLNNTKLENTINRRNGEILDELSYSLSVFQVSLYYPTILKERISAFVVPQIYSLARVSHDVPGTRIC